MCVCLYKDLNSSAKRHDCTPALWCDYLSDVRNIVIGARWAASNISKTAELL